jgi:EmrB/QacA subfamily drug resistance transporter
MEYRWTVLTVTTVGIFMSSLDSSIIIVGLPSVIEDLHTTLTAGIWIITAYRLATTVLLVSIGRLADIIGRVKLYNLGFAIFTIGSGLCAFAPDATTLILFRLVQGVGSALLFTNSMAIVIDAFPKEQLGTGIGINQVAINAGTIVGYTLSGVMISLFGWRSLFWINLPVGVFGTYWAHHQLKEISHKDHDESFDLTGALTFSAALSLLLLAMTLNEQGTAIVGAMSFVSILLLALFVYLERRVAYPVIDMTLLKIREYSVGNLATLLNGIAFSSLGFLMTLYFELVRGQSPLQTGLALIPLDIALIIVGPVSGRLSDRFGAKWLSSIGLTTTGLAFVTLAKLGFETHESFVLAALVMAGFGIGFFRSPNASSVMASVPSARRGIASGVRSTVLNVSMLVSVPFATLTMGLIIPYGILSTIIGGASSSRADLELLLAALQASFLIFAAFNFAAAIISHSTRPTGFLQILSKKR